jgi:hypothetical protein
MAPVKPVDVYPARRKPATRGGHKWICLLVAIFRPFARRDTMPCVPRYLRWTAAVTAGIVVQFAFQIAFLALLVGAGNKTELSGYSGAFVTFGATVLNVIAALWVNDWLAARYPAEMKEESREPR